LLRQMGYAVYEDKVKNEIEIGVKS
jgi:hypothetical protein